MYVELLFSHCDEQPFVSLTKPEPICFCFCCFFFYFDEYTKAEIIWDAKSQQKNDFNGFGRNATRIFFATVEMQYS